MPRLRPACGLPAVALISVIFIASACGTRVEDHTAGSPSAGARATAAPSPSAAVPRRAADPTTTAPPAPSGGNSQLPAAGAETALVGRGPVSTSGRSESAPVGEPSRLSLRGAAPQSQGTARPSIPGTPPPPPKDPAHPVLPGPPDRSPVVVATVGTLSGPAASTLMPIVQGAQLWVRWINERSGLNGHPVQQILLDDSGDPALPTSCGPGRDRATGRRRLPCECHRPDRNRQCGIHQLQACAGDRLGRLARFFLRIPHVLPADLRRGGARPVLRCRTGDADGLSVENEVRHHVLRRDC